MEKWSYKLNFMDLNSSLGVCFGEIWFGGFWIVIRVVGLIFGLIVVVIVLK